MLAYAFLDSTCILVHTHEAPDEAEWKALVAGLAEDQGIRGMFVFTNGASLNVQQREDMKKVARSGVKMAVLTESKIVRGALTAIGWLGGSMRPFRHADVHSAIKWLVPATEDAARVRSVLRALQDQLGIEGSP
jgi:hypothetical protein